MAFFVNAAGEKEKPVVIWRSENPRCLRRFEKISLPSSILSPKESLDDR